MLHFLILGSLEACQMGERIYTQVYISPATLFKCNIISRKKDLGEINFANKEIDYIISRKQNVANFCQIRDIGKILYPGKLIPFRYINFLKFVWSWRLKG